MLQGEDGIGCRIRLAGKKGVPGAAEVYMYLFIAGVLALGLDLSLRGLLRLLCPSGTRRPPVDRRPSLLSDRDRSAFSATGLRHTSQIFRKKPFPMPTCECLAVCATQREQATRCQRSRPGTGAKGL